MQDFRNELPVIAGFILPNHEILNAAGIGHCRIARDYLYKNNLYDRFLQSNICAEDDYLIECIGAIKVAAYRGLRYIYIPRIHGWYLDEISKLYINRDFKPLYMDTKYSCEKEYDYYDGLEYNRTVVKRATINGTVEYCYNPLRNGD